MQCLRRTESHPSDPGDSKCSVATLPERDDPDSPYTIDGPLCTIGVECLEDRRLFVAGNDFIPPVSNIHSGVVEVFFRPEDVLVRCLQRGGMF